jgi:hypothetical protein
MDEKVLRRQVLTQRQPKIKLTFLVYHPFHIKIIFRVYCKNLTQRVQDTMCGKNAELNLEPGGTYFYHFDLESNKNFECEILGSRRVYHED